jgi:hypothetical protein
MNSIGSRLPSNQRGLLLAATSPGPRTAPPRTNADDLAIEALSVAQKARMATDRVKRRREWDDVRKFSVERLSQMLAEALCQGDYIEAANVCAMLHARKALNTTVSEHASRSFLRGSSDAAAAAAARWEELAKSLSNIVHDHCVVMQAAWIEWQHGKGAEDAMAWIHNTLCGPGFIPDENAPYGKEAQAWFDANQSEPMPQCFCGRPSHILWMKQGFCSDQHYAEAKARHATTTE